MKKIPLRIVAFKNVFNMICTQESKQYKQWVLDHLANNSIIWTINERGKQFSVQDWTNYGIIRSLHYEDGWIADFGTTTAYVQGLIKRESGITNPFVNPQSSTEVKDEMNRFCVVAKHAYDSYISALSNELFILRKKVTLNEYDKCSYYETQNKARKVLSEALNPMHEYVDNRVAQWNDAMQEIADLKDELNKLKSEEVKTFTDKEFREMYRALEVVHAWLNNPHGTFLDLTTVKEGIEIVLKENRHFALNSKSTNQ